MTGIWVKKKPDWDIPSYQGWYSAFFLKIYIRVSSKYSNHINIVERKYKVEKNGYTRVPQICTYVQYLSKLLPTILET